MIKTFTAACLLLGLLIGCSPNVKEQNEEPETPASSVSAAEPAGSGAVSDVECATPDEVRLAFYSDIRTGNFAECLAMSDANVPEGPVMVIADLLANEEIEQAQAVLDQLKTEAAYDEDMLTFLTAVVQFRSRFGIWVWDARAANVSGVKQLTEPAAYEQPILLLPLAYHSSNTSLFDTLLDRVAPSFPGVAWPLLARGSKAANSGRSDLALSSLSMAGSLFSDVPATEYWLGRAYELNRSWDEARTHYARFIEQSGDPCVGLISLGVMEGAAGRASAAMNNYTLALGSCKDPGQLATAHQNIASVFVSESNFKAAEPHYQEAIRIGPDRMSHRSRSDLASSFFARGDFDQACADYSELLDWHSQRDKFYLQSGYRLAVQNFGSCLARKATVDPREILVFAAHGYEIARRGPSSEHVPATYDVALQLLAIQSGHQQPLVPDYAVIAPAVDAFRSLGTDPQLRVATDIVEILYSPPERTAAMLVQMKTNGPASAAIGIVELEEFLVGRFGLPIPEETLRLAGEMKQWALSDPETLQFYLRMSDRYSARVSPAP